MRDVDHGAVRRNGVLQLFECQCSAGFDESLDASPFSCRPQDQVNGDENRADDHVNDETNIQNGHRKAHRLQKISNYTPKASSIHGLFVGRLARNFERTGLEIDGIGLACPTREPAAARFGEIIAKGDMVETELDLKVATNIGQDKIESGRFGRSENVIGKVGEGWAVNAYLRA